MSETDDSEAWVRRCQDGDRTAFEPLVRQYRRQAYAAALGLVKRPEDALDVTQEAFIRAYRAIGDFDAGRPFYPWLKTIIRNTALSWLSKRRPTTNAEGLDQQPWTVTPDMLASRREEIERLRRALNRLGERDREILYLKHYEQLKYKEIAQALDIPIGTVMSRLYAARVRLRGLFEKGPA